MAILSRFAQHTGLHWFHKDSANLVQTKPCQPLRGIRWLMGRTIMVSKLRGLRKLGVLKQDSQGKPARRAKMEAHLASPGNIPKKTLRSWELPNPPSYEKKNP